MKKEETNIIELTEESMESMVYTIRGVKVMLDFDLARIYGYETRAFNQQVQRNIEKFPEDFMFQLTVEEVDKISRCQNVTAIKSSMESEDLVRSKNLTSRNAECEKSTNSSMESEEISVSQNVTSIKSSMESEEITRSKNLTSIMQTKGTKGGRTYHPYAFTEQGIYMLMTVLKGELAVQQSIKLVRLFKRMKDYISESKNLIDISQLFALINTVSSNTRRIGTIEESLDVVMGYFMDPLKYKDFAILNGRKLDADLAYQEIYFFAKHSVLVIDDYIGLKTLDLLRACREGTSIIICSDNKAKNKVTDDFINDFIEQTGLSLTLKKNNGVFHDRFIVVDYGFDSETIYHCGASSKDAGEKVSVIATIERKEFYHPLIEKIVG